MEVYKLKRGCNEEMDSSNERKCWKTKEPLIQKKKMVKLKKKKSEDPKKKNFSQETGLQMCYPTKI